MTIEDKQYLLALHLIPGVGTVLAKNLVAYAGGPKAVFTKPRGQLLRIPDVGPSLADCLKADPTPYLKRAEENIAFSQKNNIRMLAYSEAAYPERLKTIYNAPLVLFVKGAVPFNQKPAIGIVGTRKASDYGKEQAARFAQAFAEQGIQVVSGLAYGIDIAAHKATLAAQGSTLAVLAHGLDMVYPAVHRTVAERMEADGGLVTEYLTGTRPEAVNFPSRNRILSGLCEGVVVIEAAEKGGALITARLAFDQNRSVYAIPGRVNDRCSAGCNRIISDQVAKLVTSPAQVLEDLGLALPEGTAPPRAGQEDTRGGRFRLIDENLSTDEQQVLNLLSAGELAIEPLAIRLRIPIAQVVSLLFTLEFKGYVAQKPGQVFRRL